MNNSTVVSDSCIKIQSEHDQKAISVEVELKNENDKLKQSDQKLIENKSICYEIDGIEFLNNHKKEESEVETNKEYKQVHSENALPGSLSKEVHVTTESLKRVKENQLVCPKAYSSTNVNQIGQSSNTTGFQPKTPNNKNTLETQQKSEVELIYEQMLERKVNIFKVVRETTQTFQAFKSESGKPVQYFSIKNETQKLNFNSFRPNVSSIDVEKKNQTQMICQNNLQKIFLSENSENVHETNLAKEETGFSTIQKDNSAVLKTNLDFIREDFKNQIMNNGKEGVGFGRSTMEEENKHAKSSSFINANIHESKFINQMSSVFRTEIQKIVEIIYIQNIEYQNTLFSAISKHFEQQK